jgi:hypothetical protein
MPRCQKHLLVTGLLFALLSGQAEAQQGGIEFFSGESLGADILRVSAFHAYERRTKVSRHSEIVDNPQDLRLQENTTTLALDYGLLPRLTINVQMPVTHRELRVRGTGNGEIYLRGYGIGDASFAAKFTFFKQDWKQGALHLGAIVGLELPTGDVSQRDEGIRLPRAAQPGSGSWDPFFAVSANSSLNRFRFDAFLHVRVNTKNRYEFDSGEDVTFALDVAYRFWHAKYPGPSASARLGMRTSWQGHGKQDGHKVSNSGNTRVRLRPSLGFHPIPRIDLSVNADIPVYQRYRGVQLAHGVRVNFAFGIRF